MTPIQTSFPPAAACTHIPSIRLLHVRALLGAQGTNSSACTRSAHTSSTSSMPMLKRIRFSLMPISARRSGPKAQYDCTAGISIKLSTPPSEGAMYGSLTLSMKLMHSCSPPRTSKLTTPPKPLIWRAAMAWSGWLSSPGYHTRSILGCASRRCAMSSAEALWRSTRSCSVFMPRSSRYLVAECSTRSAPRVSACWLMGVAKVLSMQTWAPLAWQRRAMAGMSTQRR
ncbi:hypothetical protein TSOC_002498 [Tetrabaena socialis]|uniref:Uncharacterized protein n=1 Tax=Tetrabaena socialis TaxID=47790 RepID=A0A2J8ADZ4_9CHLO|nr:hypothetical protein TSOC_002498 [Tetrabaena socialis]|eukprot:PNH10729.1 hypothetical protein TSOC_002498 [Tetrabaena socialis]